MMYVGRKEGRNFIGRKRKAKDLRMRREGIRGKEGVGRGRRRKRRPERL